MRQHAEMDDAAAAIYIETNQWGRGPEAGSMVDAGLANFLG
jgi:hypothetical protein